MFGKAERRHLSNPLHLPPTMRDFAACFGDHAVRVSESSCSGSSISPSSSERPPPQNTISSFYRTTLSTQKELLIKVTWRGNNGDTFVLVMVEENCQILRKKKGSRSFAAGNLALALHWDISAAKYGAGPEPTKDFYLVMVANKDLVLIVGDMSKEFIKKLEDKLQIVEFWMYSRREQVLGTTLYSTKARFRDGGRDHDILIRCKGGECDAKDAELSFCVDKKRLINVKSIKWNFRGNRTVIIDGAAVDVLWDVHDWWFLGSSSGATFMFRTRSTLDSRLWSEEELARGTSQFTLLIQALKSQ